MNKSRLTHSMARDIRHLVDTSSMLFTDNLHRMACHYSYEVLDPNSDQEYYIPHFNLTNCGFKQYRPILLGLLARPRKHRISKSIILNCSRLLKFYMSDLLVGRPKGSLLEPLLAEWAKQAANEDYSGDDLFHKWKTGS